MKRILLCLLSLILIGSCGCGQTTYSELKIVCFSLGKADAFLIISNVGAVLIDTGYNGDAATIAACMDDNGVDAVDTLILSHFDKDHVGGAAALINAGRVKRVVHSDRQKDSDEYRAFAVAQESIEVIVPDEPMTFSLGNARFAVYPPEEGEYNSDDSNNASVVTFLQYGKCSFLFTGDAKKDRIKELQTIFKSKIDFLKVPYHGNYIKNLDDWLAKIKPDRAVITSSESEPYDSRTVEALEAVGTTVYYTVNGAITVTCDGKNMTFSQ